MSARSSKRGEAKRSPIPMDNSLHAARGVRSRTPKETAPRCQVASGTRPVHVVGARAESNRPSATAADAGKTCKDRPGTAPSLLAGPCLSLHALGEQTSSVEMQVLEPTDSRAP